MTSLDEPRARTVLSRSCRSSTAAASRTLGTEVIIAAAAVLLLSAISQVDSRRPAAAAAAAAASGRAHPLPNATSPSDHRHHVSTQLPPPTLPTMAAQQQPPQPPLAPGGNQSLPTISAPANQRPGEPFTACGHIIKAAAGSAGQIASPFFPKPFPVPIQCRWTIEAPAGHVVALFLTQFYLREGFRATEYAFLDQSLNVGRRELGPIEVEDPTKAVLITSKPILVLELELFDGGNVHLRVMDHYLDAHGFNVTYQLVPKENSAMLGQLTAGCSAAACSFTGQCFASSDYTSHYCACFPGWFGRRCQFGPRCDPARGRNPCRNGGHCRYQYGSVLIACECPVGYEGHDCARTALNRSSVPTQMLVLPPPTLTPLTKTVWEGDPVVITCYSPEDVPSGKYGYNWLKNGEILNPVREGELMEDLWPTGTRVLIPLAQRTAEYSCLSISPFGTRVKSSLITVVPRFNLTKQLPTCAKSLVAGIEWPQTAANSHFVQKCPKTAGFDSGDVRRFCRMLDGEKIHWDDPDYSECFSQTFLNIKEKFEKLRLGYEEQGTSITTLVYDLAVYLNGRTLKRGEGQPVVAFLTDSISYLQSITLDREQLEQSTEFALDILSQLLDHSGSIIKPSDLSMTHHLIVEYAILRGTSRPSLYVQIARPNFWSELVQIEPEDSTIQFPLNKSPAKVKARKSGQGTGTLKLINNHVPRWLTDTVELNLTRWRSAASQDRVIGNGDLILAVFYRNFATFLPKYFLQRRHVADVEYQIHSRLVTVTLVNGAGSPNVQTTASSSTPLNGSNGFSSVAQAFSWQQPQSKLKIKAHLKHRNLTDYMPPESSAEFVSEIACGLAELGDRIRFQQQQCLTTGTSDDGTTCLCDLTGTFALMLTSQMRQRARKRIDLEAVACVAWAVLVALALMALVVFRKKTVNHRVSQRTRSDQYAPSPATIAQGIVGPVRAPGRRSTVEISGTDMRRSSLTINADKPYQMYHPADQDILHGTENASVSLDGAASMHIGQYTIHDDRSGSIVGLCLTADQAAALLGSTGAGGDCPGSTSLALNGFIRGPGMVQGMAPMSTILDGQEASPIRCAFDLVCDGAMLADVSSHHGAMINVESGSQIGHGSPSKVIRISGSVGPIQLQPL